jgi:hypothetical protein
MSRSQTVTIALVLLSSAACRKGQPLVVLHRELPPRSAERILERLLAREADDTIRYYSARASVSVRMPQNDDPERATGRDFKAQLRCVRDSALWVSVVPALGIEVARVLLTPDSLKIIDRVADQYFVGDTADTRRKFGLWPDPSFLQQALLGKAIGLDPTERYRSDREDRQYVLTSREKRRFIRAASDIDPGDTLDTRDMAERRLERTLRKAEEREAVVMRYWIDPDEFRVTRVQIADLARDQVADVRYQGRGGVEESFLPTFVRITLSEPGRLATGTLELSRIVTSEPVSVPFKIPEKFTPMP